MKMEEEIIQGGEEKETPKIDPKVEERAKIQGWVPKEDFRGDEARWISAEEFVKRADHMMPILKSVNRKLETQVSETNRKLAETQKLIEKMVTINTKYIDDSYDSKVAEIRSQKRKAVEDGNTTLYDDLDRREATIKKPEKIDVPAAVANATDTVHPEMQRFEEDNKTWFGVDQEMTEYAYFVGEQLKNRKSPLALPGKEKEFFDEVSKRIKTTFATKFSNPNRNRTEVDESGLRGSDMGGGNGKKGWNDLPDEAKRQCNKLMAEIKDFKKEQYIKDYFEGV
jgi:hypothetical protein